MEKKAYNVAIIGAGPGGYIAAIKASQLGKKVALIEKQYLGGVCLNVGCIPTKALLSCTDALDIIKHANTYGLETDNISFDLAKMIERKDRIIQDLRNGLSMLLKSNKIDIIEGKGTFETENSIKVNGQTNAIIEAKNIVVATGSVPMELPNIKIDHKVIYNSNSILCLKNLPKSLVIVGGGYIGCEFASFYARLGVKITIIEAFESILFSHGKDIAALLTKSFKTLGIEIKTSARVQEIDKTSNGINVKLDTNEQIQADIALIAVGRKPNTSELNLEKLNFQMGKHKEIIVDDKMQTSKSHIYAIGDVIGKWMIAHTASHEALVAINNICGKEAKMDFSAVPAIIFTKPEIAIVGMTKEKAKENNIEVETGRFPFTALGKAHASSEKSGFVEVVVDKKTKRILGAGAIGPSASVLIAEMGLAITNKLTVEDVTETIHAHPTLPESWLEALLISQDTPLNFPPGVKL